MQSLMMETPLQIKTVLWRAEHLYGHKEVIARTDDGFNVFTLAELGRRARRLSNVLTDLGIRPGDGVGTLAWNTAEHLVSYYAVPCMGAVLHTINTRLSDEHIAYIIAHAQDTVLLVSNDQIPLLERLRDRLAHVRADIQLNGPVVTQSTLPVPAHSYAALMAAASDEYAFPDLDEHTAASMRYTSGTTGDPKGVVYSHRSTVLHALGLCTTGTIGVSEAERYMLVTPLSHVNSWGMPSACVLQGATIVLPGDHPVDTGYLAIIDHARPTVLVGAVTVGMLIRRALEQYPGKYDISSLHTLWLGGQAPPIDEMKWWKQHHNIHVTQAWGMTEASPVLTFCGLTTANQHLDEDARFEIFGSQGQPLPLVELRLVDDDEREVSWDGTTQGEVPRPRAVGDPRLLRRSSLRRQLHRRVVPHRRHRHDDTRRLPHHRRPRQGPHQERRRTDLVGGTGERADRPPENRRGLGDQRTGPEVDRTACRLHRRRRGDLRR